MTVESIKEAIAKLPDSERQSLSAWLNELDYDDWDRQMVADFSSAGRGMALVDEIKRQIAEGKAIPFQEVLEQAGTKRERQRR
jgi:hypothetical protein